MINRLLKIAALFVFCVTSIVDADDRYGKLVEADKPIAWWRFQEFKDGRYLDSSENQLHAKVVGNVKGNLAGPRPSNYPDFDSSNEAIHLAYGKNYLTVQDPGKDSVLDFAVGDGITLEAWVKIEGTLKTSYPYIIGKGRTHNAGTHPNNQSYSLRLATKGGTSTISFFFVDPSGVNKHIHAAGHRWTSDVSVPTDGYWHHVAVTYVFGEKESLRGYIDGKLVNGKWDLAGSTTSGPIVDDDELWIGSAVQGGSTLGGSLDEVAIYRKALSAEAIQKHANVDIKIEYFAFDEVDKQAPADHVQVDILESLSADRSWKFLSKEMTPLYQTDVFALNRLPNKYNNKGLIIDRAVPSLLRLSSTVEFKAGEYEFLLRSLDASRIYIDGKLVAETKFLNPRSDAHQEYYRLPDYGNDLLSLAAGQLEDRKTVKLAAGKHTVTVYRLVGHKGKGDYLGEFNVGYALKGEQHRFLSPVTEIQYTDAGWLEFLDEDSPRLVKWNQQERLKNSLAEQEYWKKRHAWAKNQLAPKPQIPSVKDRTNVKTKIDQFIQAKLEEENLKPTEQIPDREFLRRVTLDTIGTIPSPALIEKFFEFPRESRRSEIINVLLNDPAYADHWVGYWQDVLAENPGLTKPELNNSGPFRWYLYESFLDNKSFDRFVTELAMMEGSAYSGGPAGFRIASQNDVPMAAKAHIMGTAFLAVEMKCARCHDAPYHDVLQEDLFSFAALLKRGDQKVPGSSSIPLSPEEVENLAVAVTLTPGSSVKPKWPFSEFVSLKDSDQLPLPKELLRNPNDTREQLAAMLTTPYNERFNQVIVNRVWDKLIGRGFVHPVDDWEEAEVSHPELLEYLSGEFVRNGYDLKSLMKSILISDIYQRGTVPGLVADSLGAEKFRGPIRRKMTGEQLVDSLYAATEKPFGSEKLTMDADGKRPDSIFVHLGVPQRAWQLITVSNERDRPSMSLPVAQSIIDLMSAYGWRQQRQEPTTHREDPLTALQPMALANGVSSHRAIDFSDDSALTKAALKEQSVEQFVEELFERLLTRVPNSEERALFSEMLRDGYDSRIVAGPEAIPPKRMFRSGITWINHFHPDADHEAIQRSREILEGDRKSVRLDPEWRQRAEDAVWVLVNSPEFIFIP